MNPFRHGLITAVLTLVADQASKLWLYFRTDIVLTQPWQIAPFADFVVVWNRGVSYGLFQQETDLGRWGLVALALVAALGLGAWMSRADTRLLAVSLGLIVGGAVGNAIDRILFGAVFDFIHLHWGEWSWYVFNIADAAIVAGVVGLILDSLLPRQTASGTPGVAEDASDAR